MNLLFGVCANKWSPDDGRVVSIDHGCGEHSEFDPPEPSHLWVQSKPAFDDMHIDIIAQAPRDERGSVELIEQLSSDDDHNPNEDEAKVRTRTSKPTPSTTTPAKRMCLSMWPPTMRLK